MADVQILSTNALEGTITNITVNGDSRLLCGDGIWTQIEESNSYSPNSTMISWSTTEAAHISRWNASYNLHNTSINKKPERIKGHHLISF